jgi:hypothetical protein
MTRPITSLLFILICFCSFGQEAYYVLHVQGKVSNSAGALKARDKIMSSDLLDFSSESAFAVVFSGTSGRKILRPVNKSSESQSLLSYYVSENLFPVQNQLSTRGGDELRSFSDLKDYFATPVLVIDQLALNVNKDALGINEANVLTLSADDMEITGAYTEKGWVITLDELAQLPAGKGSLNFKDTGFGSVMPVCDITLSLKTKDELKEEIKFYRDLSEETFDEAALKDHLETVYGRFDVDYLKELME